MNEIPINSITIMLEDLNAKIGRKKYFRPIISSYSLSQVSNDTDIDL